MYSIFSMGLMSVAGSIWSLSRSLTHVRNLKEHFSYSIPAFESQDMFREPKILYYSRDLSQILSLLLVERMLTPNSLLTRGSISVPRDSEGENFGVRKKQDGCISNPDTPACESIYQCV